MQQGRTAGKRPILKSITDYLESGYKAPRAIALMLSKKCQHHGGGNCRANSAN